MLQVLGNAKVLVHIESVTKPNFFICTKGNVTIGALLLIWNVPNGVLHIFRSTPNVVQ